MRADIDPETLRETVRAAYAERALTVIQGASAACCSSACDPVTADLYPAEETSALPEDAVSASLGCGNPTALASLESGDVVLDLGSGGGMDVLLSARRVGPTGFAYGLDMTDEMLALAERNRAEHGLTNVQFLKGHIEDVPLPDSTVDVVISNCVINLSADKARVLREAFRVLRPGGRFAVSDVVVQGETSPELRRDMEAWVGCVAGALAEPDYRGLLAEAGFRDIELEVTRVYDAGELGERAACWGASVTGAKGQMDGRVVSAFVRATKPRQA